MYQGMTASPADLFPANELVT